MSRIPTPSSVDSSPTSSQPLLDAAKRQLDSVPNMFRIIGNSPAALEGYLALSVALGKGQLDAATRTAISLAVAERNGCDYCLSAHTYLGVNLVKVDAAELAANRDARSGDARRSAALQFAGKLVAERGRVTAADVEAVSSAGYSAAEVVEIVLHVALNTLTNYVNIALATDFDFPIVTHRTA